VALFEDIMATIGDGEDSLGVLDHDGRYGHRRSQTHVFVKAQIIILLLGSALKLEMSIKGRKFLVSVLFRLDEVLSLGVRCFSLNFERNDGSGVNDVLDFNKLRAGLQNTLLLRVDLLLLLMVVRLPNNGFQVAIDGLVQLNGVAAGLRRLANGNRGGGR